MTDITAAPVARELPLEPGGTVEIALSSGDVRIRGTDSDRVVIRGRDGRPVGDELRVDAEPGRIRIGEGKVDFRLGPLSLRTHGSPDLDIDVPATAAIAVRTMSGDVEATGIVGPSRWASASGNVRVAAAGGPVQVETMSGDAQLEASATLDLGARTVSGDIRIRATRLLSSDIGSTSGDVRIEAELDRGGRHAVSSVSGDVEIATPSPVRLEGATIAGDVRGQGPHTAEGARSRRTLVVGDGSVLLSVRTTSGDVRLRVLGAAPAPPVPPVAPVPPVPPLSNDVPVPPVAPEPPTAPDAPAAPAGAREVEAAHAASDESPAAREEPPASPHVPDVPVVKGVAERTAATPRPPDDDDTHAWNASQPLVDRREEERLDILRALERGEVDIETASHRLEILEESGPRFFRGVVLMAADPLDEVLRLVAEGRLTADEAAPILAALDERGGPAPRPDPAAGSGGAAGPGSHGRAGPGDTVFDDTEPRRATSLRLEIRDGPRSVVNLRLPLSVGKFALDKVPGLSGDQVDRIREALASGVVGPILSVDDGDETVRIVVVSAIAGARSLPMWQALRVRDFRLLWGSEAISLIGDQFHIVALSWLVIDLTRSGLALGVVLIASGIPRALMLLPFGVLADRRPPRTLMLIAHLARGVIVGAMAALVLSDTASLPLLALLGAAFGAVDALYLPAQQAFLPRVVDGDRLPSANALLQVTLQLTSIVGPPIAGAMIAVVGTGTAFVVDTASFVLAAVVVLMISSRGAIPVRASSGNDVQVPVADAAAAPSVADPTPAAEAQPAFTDAIRHALHHINGDPALRMTLLLSMLLNFALNGPAIVGMPWLAEIRFEAGPAGIGLLTAAWAAGALAGTVVAGNVRVARPGRILLLAVAIAGAAMVGVGLAPWLPAASVAFAVMGLCIGYCNIVAISWMQSRVPTEMVGRVMSVAMLMGFAVTPLSLGIAGALLDVQATAMFLGAGVLVAAVAGIGWLRRFPARFDAPSPQPVLGRRVRA